MSILQAQRESAFLSSRVKNGSPVFSIHDNHIFRLETVHQGRGLGGYDKLGFLGSGCDQFGQYPDGKGMQSEFRLVDDDGGGRPGLEQSGCQADESNGAVGQVMGFKGIVRTLLAPSEPYFFVSVGFQDEIMEKRRYDSNGLHNFFITAGLFFFKPKRKGAILAASKRKYSISSTDSNRRIRARGLVSWKW